MKFNSWLHDQATPDLLGTGTTLFNHTLMDNVKVQNAAGADLGKFISTGAVELYHNGSKKAETVSGGFTVTGTATATTFSGSGASLTSLPAANVTGQLSATAVTIDYDNLPTSDPNVKGRMWLQNYAIGKVLCISDG